MRTFIIAEIGVNHNGSVDIAKKLVDAAFEAGSDAVKFQTFTAESLVLPGAEQAQYQKARANDTDQLQMLKKLELTPTQHFEIKKHCDDLGIEFMSTAFDIASMELLIELGIRRIKIPSGEVTNQPFIEYLAAKGLPIILSTGMSTLDEVSSAVAVIRSVWSETNANECDLTVLHCTSNYPAKYSDVNLLAMETIGRHCKCAIGYSDHTQGAIVPVMAVALGARVIEKHITLDRSMSGPDHFASMEPNDFTQMVNAIRNAERCLGNAEKTPTESELEVKELVRRSIVIGSDLQTGDEIKREHLIMLRPGKGISPANIHVVVGKHARTALNKGHVLALEDFE